MPKKQKDIPKDYDPFDHDGMWSVNAGLQELMHGVRLLEAYNDEMASSELLSFISSSITKGLAETEEWVRAVQERVRQDLEQDGA